LKQLKGEVAILIGIQGQVPLAVPLPTHVNLEGQKIGRAFVGYKRLPGEPLWRETYREINDEETVKELATQLGAFLRALHSVPYDTVIDSDLPAKDTYEECAGTYRRIREKLFGYMRSDARKKVARHFESFLVDRSNFEHEPVLKHGDLGPSNILFDRAAQKISGVIDFGNAGLGDPAYDFTGLLSGYGEQFVRQCGRAYQEVETFLDRIRFYRGTFALLEALFGIENGDQKAFRAGIQAYI